MQTNSQLRQTAKEQLTGRWKPVLIVTLVYFVIIGACAALPKVGSLVMLLVAGPLAMAWAMMTLKLVRNGETPAVEGLFTTFCKEWYLKSVALNLLVGIYTLLWSLLLLVPGVIKALAYSMSTFVLADNPDMTCEQAICESMRLMQGHKMDLFLIMLGLFGLTLLSMLLAGIPLLWLMPYYQTVFANFYTGLKDEDAAAAQA